MDAVRERGVGVVAISIDPPDVSHRFKADKGFSFDVLSDVEMNVIDTYGLRNPDNPELALHAAYLIRQDGKVAYRKVARRRVEPDELIAAIDFFLP